MWKKGLMKQVIGAIVEIAFNEIGLDKLTAGSYENNIASNKVLEKNGFFLEGRRVKQLLYEGVRIDSLIFGRLR